jgi:hypothetical protein
MSTDDESHLGRWSRLKRKSAKGEAVEEASPAPAEEPAKSADAPRPARGAAAPVAGKPYLPPLADLDTPVPQNALISPVLEEEPEDARELTEAEAAYVETLPAIDDLNPDCDFSGFMDKRVPEFLRRQALRKLWLSDPAFSLIDGMHEYGEDYSMMAQLAAGASAYRPDEGGYGWRDKPKDPETEEAADAGAASLEEGGDPADGEADGKTEESVADKAQRMQGRGGSDVSLPTYTPNPYYQAPGQRHPAPEALPERSRAQVSRADGGDDDLGDGEDDLG